MALIECVPNISEGRRADVVDAHGRRRRGARRRAPARRRPTRPQPHRCSRWPATPDARRARRSLALFDAALDAHRPAHAPGRASAPRRGRRRAVHPDRGRDDGRLRGAGRAVGAEVAHALRPAGVPLRRGRDDTGPAQSRGHPSRRVRRAGRQDAAAGVGARLRAGRAASRRPAPPSSARACRSSPTTSTSPPIGSTSPRRSPRPSGTAAAASAT